MILLPTLSLRKPTAVAAGLSPERHESAQARDMLFRQSDSADVAECSSDRYRKLQYLLQDLIDA